MTKLNHVFYIYSESSMAALMIVGALIELLCGAALGGEIQMYLANPAAALFAVIALLNVWYVVRAERRFA